MGSASQDDMSQRDAQPQLPAAEMRNLQAIAELLVEVPIFRRAKLIEAVLQQDYVLQLVTLFKTVEDLENVPDLHHLFHIFKGLVLLNDTGVYEELLREDLIVSVIGALSTTPSSRATQSTTAHSSRRRSNSTRSCRSPTRRRCARSTRTSM